MAEHRIRLSAGAWDVTRADLAVDGCEEKKIDIYKSRPLLPQLTTASDTLIAMVLLRGVVVIHEP